MTRWLPALWVLFFACTSDPPPAAPDAGPPVGPILCDRTVPCPDALVCVDGFCVAAVMDAAVAAPDALPSADDAQATEDAAPEDAGAEPTDAAPLPDATSPADATSEDAAPAADATTLDATTFPDAAVVVDATTPVDATIARDAAAPDASAPDAAGGADAATGATDAGNLCRGAADCIPGAEICGRVTVENNRVVTRCGPPVAGGAPVGGMCTADGQCGSGLCLDGITNECTTVCASAASDCPAGYACVGYTYNPGAVTVPVCNRGCADDDDCPSAGTLCSVATYQSAGAWQLSTVCQLAAGTVPLGGACTTPNDCRSGICLSTRRVNAGCAACTGGEVCIGTDCVLQACTAICDDAADCASGGAFTRCAPGLNFTLPDNTTRGVSACQRP